jgi:hypothetical protein
MLIKGLFIIILKTIIALNLRIISKNTIIISVLKELIIKLKKIVIIKRVKS